MIDEAGKPVASACTAPAFRFLQARRVDQHRRPHLPLRLHRRAARGLQPRAREAPHRALPAHGAGPVRAEGLVRGERSSPGGAPAGTLVRVGGAGQGMQRWAVSYTCQRPANAPDGPVADICLQYTADMSLDSIGALKLYADPVEERAARRPISACGPAATAAVVATGARISG
ncbi:hypothetical protein ACRAWF_10550 [Streptomyces sp. L7]